MIINDGNAVKMYRCSTKFTCIHSGLLNSKTPGLCAQQAENYEANFSVLLIAIDQQCQVLIFSMVLVQEDYKTSQILMWCCLPHHLVPTIITIDKEKERKNIYSNEKYLILQCLHT